MPFFFVQYCVLCFFFLKDRFFVLFDLVTYYILTHIELMLVKLILFIN